MTLPPWRSAAPMSGEVADPSGIATANRQPGRHDRPLTGVTQRGRGGRRMSKGERGWSCGEGQEPDAGCAELRRAVEAGSGRGPEGHGSQSSNRSAGLHQVDRTAGAEAGAPGRVVPREVSAVARVRCMRVGRVGRTLMHRRRGHDGEHNPQRQERSRGPVHQAKADHQPKAIRTVTPSQRFVGMVQESIERTCPYGGTPCTCWRAGWGTAWAEAAARRRRCFHSCKMNDCTIPRSTYRS